MVIPVVFLLLVVVSPTTATTRNTDEAFNARLFDAGGTGGLSGGGDGNLGLDLIAAPLITLAVLAAIAGSTNNGATAVPGSTTILTQVPTPRVCPTCPAMTVCPTLTPCTPMPACPPNYQRIGIPGGVAGAVLQSCYRVLPATAPNINYNGAARMCAADNAVPVEFDKAGESEAIAALIAGTPGRFFTGHTDAFSPVVNIIVGISSGIAAVSGPAFPVGAGGIGTVDCGVITAPPGSTSPSCATAIAAGVVCEISLAGATCFCPPGTG